jgi:hypothetical protein
VRKTKQELWTVPLLNQAFERFCKENGHYPSALEIDACPYLCTSRLIQLKFGGLQQLRNTIGLDFVRYASGDHRKVLWEKAGEYSLKGETAIGDFLRNRYGEICVHEEKKYGEGRNRLDFYVYAKPNFAVEVFNTFNERSLIGNLDAKLKKYGNFPDILYLVVTGAVFSQSTIEKIINHRHAKPLKSNMKCMTQETFMKYCVDNIEPLNIKVSL